MGLVDRFGRVHDDLRISVTDRCNLRCSYCMPVEPVWYPHEHLLHYEEIAQLVRLFARQGIRKLRVTGGEPLVRRDLPLLIGMLRGIDGIEDFSLTTNGILLGRFAADLAAAGLSRVNVSLDTLDHERFRRITRRDRLDDVLAGLDAAVRFGLSPVKVNAVLLRGENEDELETLVEHSRERGWELRLIEYMPLENDGSWRPERVVRGDELRRRISRRWPIEPDPDGDPHAPATRWRFTDGRGRIGFIDSISDPFCSSCSRLRLTCDGILRACLYDDVECDLKTPLRNGAGEEELLRRIRDTVERKGQGGALQILEQRHVRPQSRTMHQIGG
ncbi:MAG: GTP 3',8-cyclase MoaA [Acidobacteria bacterium]|nr:GTP 3',8-cyclase MoaA [Acidobacteriota bacterium]NIM63475.1 GTP 3',8-cyclase MoaA [Acidobacteriota bacterium]NIO60903.1 GTP 3',8-cyclase MoaA [Acidobacteriota bacterium]NIQ31095.1 GTP 3',8-cyclase MoaA [Acidobacteriota bacterium]NIQ87364.1 GTP 3',8-cyclase MoaA [Acidobacteriota bacterium]